MNDVLANQNFLMEKVLREHGAAIRGAVEKAMGGLPCADDIMAEVHFAIFLALRKLGGEWKPPRSFIFAVIRNKVSDVLRRKCRHKDGVEELKKHKAAQTTEREHVKARIPTLTHGEFRVFRLVGLGLSNLEIAASLHLSPFTVRSHMRKIHAKCAVKEREKLAIISYQACHQEPTATPEDGPRPPRRHPSECAVRGELPCCMS